MVFGGSEDAASEVVATFAGLLGQPCGAVVMLLHQSCELGEAVSDQRAPLGFRQALVIGVQECSDDVKVFGVFLWRRRHE